MKRIRSACLIQTVCFAMKDDLPREEAARLARREYDHYRASLDRNGTRYRIIREQTMEDGSIEVEIKKQYNYHDCGSYLDG